MFRGLGHRASNIRVAAFRVIARFVDFGTFRGNRHATNCPGKALTFLIFPTGKLAKMLGTARWAWAVAIFAWLGACGADEPVTIAVSLGTLENDGARLAYQEAVAAGLSHPIDTIFDVATDTRAAPAIEAAQQITSSPRVVAIVGPNNSAAALAAAPVYNDRRIVQLSPNATAVLYSSAGPYSYRMVSPDDRQGEFLANHLMATAAGRRVALMYVNDDYGRGLRREVLRAVRPGSIEWVMDAPHIEGLLSEGDKKVAALVESRPDVLLWLGRGVELETLLRRIQAQLGDLTIIGSDAVSSRAAVNHGNRWQNVQHVALLDLNGSPEIRAFRQGYRSRFGREPTAVDALAYDAMKLVIAAVENGARTGTDVQKYLDEVGRTRPAFKGATGPVVFNEAGDVDRGYGITVISPAP